MSLLLMPYKRSPLPSLLDCVCRLALLEWCAIQICQTAKGLTLPPAASASAAAASSDASGADTCCSGDGLTSTTGPASFCVDFVLTEGGCTYWQCRPLREAAGTGTA